MYDCNLIKSRAQKMQEYQLPSLESANLTMQTPTNRAEPAPPAAPPEHDQTSPANPPHPEQTSTANPLLPKLLPNSTFYSVPENPLMPVEFAKTIDYESLQYMNGYLRTQIGNYAEANFLVGSTNITVVFGKLIGVGLNYILIEDTATGDVIACDFYNLKFFRTHAHGDIRRG